MLFDPAQMDALARSVLSSMLCMQRHAWEQGVAMEAVRSLGMDDLLYRMAWDSVVRQHEDGRAALVGGETVAADPCSVGGPLLYIAKKRNDPVLLAGAARLLQWARTDAPRSQDGLVYHFLGSHEIWADSIYMIPPFLAEAGYPEEAVRLTDGYFDCLLDESGLLAHRYDKISGTFVNPAHWGVGNGWALCAIVRILPFLPDKAGQIQMHGRICALLDAILPFMREDGRFHNVLDDPLTFPETNLSQMCAFAIFDGLAGEWLPSDSPYTDAALAMAGAAVSAVSQDGFVFPVCGAPRFDAPGTAPEGQAFFLLMKTAMDRAFAVHPELTRRLS